MPLYRVLEVTVLRVPSDKIISGLTAVDNAAESTAAVIFFFNLLMGRLHTLCSLSAHGHFY